MKKGLWQCISKIAITPPSLYKQNSILSQCHPFIDFKLLPVWKACFIFSNRKNPEWASKKALCSPNFEIHYPIAIPRIIRTIAFNIIFTYLSKLKPINLRISTELGGYCNETVPFILDSLNSAPNSHSVSLKKSMHKLFVLIVAVSMTAITKWHLNMQNNV